MSKIQQVEQVVLTMTPEEQEKLRDWLENLLEDRFELTDESQGKIKQAESHLSEVIYPAPSLNEGGILIADTWEKLGPAPDIDYGKL